MLINKKEILHRLSIERKKFGTQEKVANLVGISEKSVGAIENGRINPSFETFIKICFVINADVNYIIYGEKFGNKNEEEKT